MRVTIWILAIWVIGAGGYLLFEHLFPLGSGKIVVISDPPGAAVLLDLKPSGQTTEATLSGVRPGKHSVKAVMSGHRADPFASIVDVTNGSLDTLRFTLVPAAGDEIERRVSARRTAPPEESSIEERARLNPPFAVESPAPKKTPAPPEVRPPATTTEHETLREQTTGPTTGTVEISSSIPGAAIFIADSSLPEVTPASLTLPFGTYNIRVELRGYSADPIDQTVRVARAASSQFVYFKLREHDSRGYSVETSPVAGKIYADSVLIGEGKASVNHDFGTVTLTFGDMPGYRAPDPVRVNISPAKSRQEVKVVYSPVFRASVRVETETSVSTEGDVRWEAGAYFDDSGPQVSASFGPKIREVPDSKKFAWELAMGDQNRNPTGGDYVEFIFTLPPEIPADSPLNLRLFLYRSSNRYPLTLGSTSEIFVTVNGRIFLDGYRPQFTTETADQERFEEWSLQRTLRPGENRILVRAGTNNQVFDYLWKIEIQ